MEKNKVKFGLSNCVMAPLTINSTTGKYEYSTPIKVPGAVNLSLSPNGDTEDFFADNTIYYSSTANQGYEGDLEISLIPDKIRTAIFGEKIDANGAFIENAEDKSTAFAFGFQIDGDARNRRYWYYNCTLKRPNNDGATVETTKTPKTDSLTIKSMPRLSDHAVRVFLEPNENNQHAYDNFFNSVYEKVLSGV